MVRPYFEETQSFKQVRWIWFITIPFLFLTAIALIYKLYWQVVQGETLEDRPMTDSGLIIVSIFTFLVIGLVLWILLSVKLETRIDEGGIHYRFFPHMFRWKTVHPESIEKCEVVRENIFQRGGVGYKVRMFGTPKALTIKGNILLRITLKDNSILKIGTQEPESMDRAIQRLTSTEKIS